MENPSSAGGAAPAVSDLRQARAVAGSGRHHRADTGWVRGFSFSPADYQQGRLPRMYPHVGGHLVNGYLCGDGGGGVYRAGLADENSTAAVAAMAPVGAVYTFIALVTGAAWGIQTDVGHTVGVGRV